MKTMRLAAIVVAGLVSAGAAAASEGSGCMQPSGVMQAYARPDGPRQPPSSGAQTPGTGERMQIASAGQPGLARGEVEPPARIGQEQGGGVGQFAAAGPAGEDADTSAAGCLGQ